MAKVAHGISQGGSSIPKNYLEMAPKLLYINCLKETTKEASEMAFAELTS